MEFYQNTVFDRLFDPDVFIHLTDEEIFLLAAIEAEGLPDITPNEEKTDKERLLEERILSFLHEQISKEALHENA